MDEHRELMAQQHQVLIVVAVMSRMEMARMTIVVKIVIVFVAVAVAVMALVLVVAVVSNGDCLVWRNVLKPIACSMAGIDAGVGAVIKIINAAELHVTLTMLFNLFCCISK